MPRTYGISNAAPYASAPAVGAEGDTYWNTTEKALYISDGTAWVASAGGSAVHIGADAPATPAVGQLWWRNDPDGNLFIYYDDGTSSQFVPAMSTAVGGVQPYDIALFAAGKPTASALMMRFVFARSISFQVNLAGSVASVGTAATGSTVFSLAKNAGSIGNVTFAGAATTGTFNVAAAQSFAIGDVLTVTAPASPDATLADLSITLSGLRV
jgi:hypothetical protein